MFARWPSSIEHNTRSHPIHPEPASPSGTRQRRWSTKYIGRIYYMRTQQYSSRMLKNN